MNTKWKRTALLILLFSSLLIAFQGYAADYPSFAIIGDTRIGLAERHYVSFLNAVDKEGIHLIFITGDVIDRPGTESEWKRFLELNGQGRTIHIAAGNHDINNFKSLRIYGQYIDKPLYYSFSDNDTQFLILCTDLPNEIGRITGKQLEWLRTELQKPFTIRLVFLHRPVFSSPLGRGYGLDRHPVDRDQLHQLFKQSGVNAVIAGHEHLYYRTEKDGIAYVITGGGGAPLLAFNEENGGFFHYLVAKRKNEGYLFTALDMNGTKKDEFYIKSMR